MLLKKTFWLKLKASLTNLGLYKLTDIVWHRFSFATFLAANFGFDWFELMPEIVSKRLRTAIWSGCAEYVIWNLSQHLGLGQVVNLVINYIWSDSVALHRIQFGLCGLAPIPYFPSETMSNPWMMKDWAELWALLWSVICSHEIHNIFIFT